MIVLLSSRWRCADYHTQERHAIGLLVSFHMQLTPNLMHARLPGNDTMHLFRVSSTSLVTSEMCTCVAYSHAQSVHFVWSSSTEHNMHHARPCVSAVIYSDRFGSGLRVHAQLVGDQSWRLQASSGTCQPNEAVIDLGGRQCQQNY